MRRIFTLAVATAVMLSLAASPAAAQSSAVDEATLMPQLDPSFSWSCRDTGGGPICHGSGGEMSYANVDIGIACAGQPVYLTGSGVAHQTRWHLPDGRATKMITNLRVTDHFSLSPVGEGPRVTGQSRWNRHSTYLEPGDSSTRVLTEIGAVYHATAPGYGLLFHDVGLIRFAPGEPFEEITEMHGPHDLYSSGFADLEVAVCEELTS